MSGGESDDDDDEKVGVKYCVAEFVLYVIGIIIAHVQTVFLSYYVYFLV